MATRAVLNRSQSTSVDTPGIEYFWSVKLDDAKKVYEWKPLGDDDEGMEEDDEDFISHTLFLKTAVLGAECVADQSNVVMMESEDGDGNKVEGAICHLSKTGGMPMCQLDLSMNGKNGAKFTLVGGTGPVYITGNYVQDFPRDDGMMMDNTQTEDESENEENEADESNEKMDEVEEVDDEESEEETKVTKAKKAAAAMAVKRKATASKASSKPKQKAKMDTTEEDVEDEEEEDEDENDDAEDDDDEDYEEPPAKKAVAKKAAPKAQDAKKGKKAPTPEVTKKTGKKVKK